MFYSVSVMLNLMSILGPLLKNTFAAVARGASMPKLSSAVLASTPTPVLPVSEIKQNRPVSMDKDTVSRFGEHSLVLNRI